MFNLERLHDGIWHRLCFSKVSKYTFHCLLGIHFHILVASLSPVGITYVVCIVDYARAKIHSQGLLHLTKNIHTSAM